jgi:hypothetical protein
MNRLSTALFCTMLLAASRPRQSPGRFWSARDPAIALPGLSQYAPASAAGAGAAIGRSVQMQAVLTEDGDPVETGSPGACFIQFRGQMANCLCWPPPKAVRPSSNSNRETISSTWPSGGRA